MKLIFASHNKNKVKEVAAILPKHIKLIGLHDLNYNEEIDETGATLEENALIKAKHIYGKFNLNCFADDSGLEVEVLNNEPGVYSARYAGNEKNDDANMNKLLKNLSHIENRKARFRTVIALILDGKEHLFEGIVNGKIINEKRGEKGFGYDPIFVPDRFDKTFAELSSEEKNQISHRAIATKKLIRFLENA
jgi:XTP/dITP diphosphohydrolase